MRRIDPTPDEPATETVLAQDQLPALSGPMPSTPPLAKLAPPGWKSPRRGIIFAPLLLLALSAGGFYFAPTVERAIRTISTDDAYVNSHVTFVAPRIQGEVARVLVDDNMRVSKHDLLSLAGMAGGFGIHPERHKST